MTRAAVDQILTTLAEPQRQRAVELLSERPHRAGELAHALGLTAPAMSRHLKALKASGLVEETHPEFDARVRVYALKREGLQEMKEWVEQTEAMWSAQLGAFKAHLEKDA